MATGYESAYAPTPAGAVEIKTIPPQTALAAQASGDYFQQADPLFMKLFRYISSNQVAMTIPVEADISGAGMRFMAGKAGERPLPDTADVRVLHRPEQTVVSIGLRGGYSKSAYEKGLAKLEHWLELRAGDWEAAGTPYAVYWNSPFVPGFMKRSEIHIPVRPVQASP